MDENRKHAYRVLLYFAMLDMRAQWGINPYRPSFLKTILKLGTIVRRFRYVVLLSDTMHNLAHFSALDFEHFDEDRFWKDYDLFVSRLASRPMWNYRSVFDDALAGRF